MAQGNCKFQAADYYFGRHFGGEKITSKQTDALVALEEVAVSLKESAEQVRPESSFDEGRLMGYYEALSTLMSQCAVSGIEPADIGLAEFKPEDLLKKDKKAA